MIDAHVHVWRLAEHGCRWPPPDMTAIYRHFELPEIGAVSAECGVRRMILVQSQPDPADTRWLLELAGGSSRVAGVVGWADLTAPDAAQVVEHLASRPGLVGLRLMAQDEPEAVLDDPPLDCGLAAMVAAELPLDLLVNRQQIGGCLRLAKRYPRLRIMIDHCAKPSIDRHIDPTWRIGMAHLAECANVFCKVSGLLSECTAGTPREAVLAVIAEVSALFGRERLAWGSDWPVLNLRGDYAGWLALARAGVPAADHPAVFRDNAQRFYRLDSR